MPEKNRSINRNYFLGFDGGGTKTDCILIDNQGATLGSARSGPSNPMRAGYAKALWAVTEAADCVLARRHLKSADISGVCAGLGGCGRPMVAHRIATDLKRIFPNATVEVAADFVLALEASVGEGEGVVLIAGTGSAAFGCNAQGVTARAGGQGPWISDEGSAFDIGRRAIQAVVRAKENRGLKTALAQEILGQLDCGTWDNLSDRIAKNPDNIFSRVFPLVAKLADNGDAVSCEILSTAAESLAALAASVVERLGMQGCEIPIAKYGGMMGRSKFLDAAIQDALQRRVPKSRIISAAMSAAAAGANRALRSGSRKAHGK